MTTKRLAVAALALTAVLVVLAVVALVLWRQDTAQAKVEDLFDACMEDRGLDDVSPLTPGYDGVEYANQVADCGEEAQRLARQ